MYTKQNIAFLLAALLALPAATMPMADKARIGFNKLCTGLGLYGSVMSSAAFQSTMKTQGQDADETITKFIQQELADAGYPKQAHIKNYTLEKTGSSHSSLCPIGSDTLIIMDPTLFNKLQLKKKNFNNSPFVNDPDEQMARYLCHRNAHFMMNYTNEKMLAVGFIAPTIAHFGIKKIAKAFERPTYAVPTIMQSLRAIPSGYAKAFLGAVLAAPYMWHLNQKADDQIKDDVTILKGGIQLISAEKKAFQKFFMDLGMSPEVIESLYNGIIRLPLNTVERKNRLKERIHALENPIIDLSNYKPVKI